VSDPFEEVERGPMRGTVVRVRILVEGKTVDDSRVLIGVGARDLIGVLGSRHGDIAAAAERSGKAWLVEIIFPDGDHLRWGTDPDGMVVPLEVGLADLLRQLLEVTE
jgi:hypothetical protein